MYSEMATSISSSVKECRPNIGPVDTLDNDDNDGAEGEEEDLENFNFDFPLASTSSLRMFNKSWKHRPVKSIAAEPFSTVLEGVYFGLLRRSVVNTISVVNPRLSLLATLRLVLPEDPRDPI